MHGSTISFLNMLHEVIERGGDVLVVVPTHPTPEFIDAMLEKHAKYVECPVISTCISKFPFRTFPFGLRSWLIQVTSLKYKKRVFFAQLSKIIESFNPDIIHSNVGIIHEGFLCARRKNIPHVWHIREYQDLDFGFKILPSKTKFIDMLKSSNSITISKDLLKHFNLQSSKNAIVVYNGICHKEDVMMKKERDNYFLCASRVSKEKGFDEVIPAFCEFAQSHGNYKLLVAGNGDPAYIQELKNIIEQEGCLDKVIFLGYRKDILRLMSKAKALIVGSQYEGFGRMTAEASFAGCLVIGRNTGGTKEILEKTGGYLYNNNTELLKSMKEVCLLSTDQYLSKAKQCQKIAVENFSIEANGNNIFNLYRRILASNI